MDVRGKVENEKRREEMTEYIKKDELLKFKADVYDEDGHVLYAVPTGCIVAMPPEDVMQVRHGRWIEPQRLYYGAKQYECSLCRAEEFWDKHEITEKYPCCPNCGARMDGCVGNE